MKEEWRTIKETDGKYLVSNLGNVKRNFEERGKNNIDQKVGSS